MSVLPVGIGASGDVAYTLDNSLRFRSSASAYLTRTPSSTGDRTEWTWSAWVKRSGLGSNTSLFSVDSSAATNQYLSMLINSSDEFQIFEYTGAAYTLRLATNPIFRDPSAWYHFVCAVDTDQATSSDRVKLYVNGVQQTSLRLSIYPSSGLATYANTSGNEHAVGATVGAITTPDRYMDGYMTEINFIDGQQLTPTDFGETDATTGVWKPKEYTGTYGTNGFYLDGSGVTDSSGNGNNWTNNNLNLSTSSATTYDLMTDVPTLTADDTANYCTWNPLYRNPGQASSILAYSTYSNANLTVSVPTNSYATSTMKMTSGKVYAETNLDTVTAESSWGFIWAEEFSSTSITNGSTKKWAGKYHSYAPADIQWYDEGTQQSTTTITLANNDTLQWALDVDNGKAWLGVNNTWYDSSGGTTGNPSTGANPTFTLTAEEASNLRMFVGNGASTSVYSTNFGQRPFAYTSPTGFLPVNAYNLADSTIEDGSEYFNTVLYSGNSSTQSITGVGFQPDLVWGKDRTNVVHHTLTDAVRGAPLDLFSSSTTIESNDTNGLTSFASDGFNLGSSTNHNVTGHNYVAWNWKANGSGSSISVGSIDGTNPTIASTTSANTTSGFSILTYTGSGGASDTLAHGLGVAPEFVIVFDRDSATFRSVYHIGTHPTVPASYLMRLNTTDARLSSSVYWNNTEPTSSVVTIGTSSAINDTHDYLMYCFAPVEGFSAFGAYTGNGSSDGPFVYTGFRPAWVIIKESSSTGNWVMLDTTRSTNNAINDDSLWANLADAEGGSASYFDMLSNGFKIRDTDSDKNTSGQTYIYSAFAENPFKNSLAR